MAGGAPEIRLDRAKAAWRWTRGFVEDVAEAIALAVIDDRASGRVYNVGEEDALREAEWVRAIGEAAGWTGHVRAVEREALPEAEREPYDFAHDLVADTSRASAASSASAKRVGTQRRSSPVRRFGAARSAPAETQTGRARRRTRPIPRSSSPAARTIAPT